MNAYDIKVYLDDRSLASWRQECDSVWDAIAAAFKRYENHPVAVRGVSAIRVNEGAAA